MFFPLGCAIGSPNSELSVHVRFSPLLQCIRACPGATAGLTQVTRHVKRPRPLRGQRADLRTALPRGDALSAAVGSGISKSFAVGRLWFLAYVCHLELSFQDKSCVLSCPPSSWLGRGPPGASISPAFSPCKALPARSRSSCSSSSCQHL